MADTCIVTSLYLQLEAFLDKMHPGNQQHRKRPRTSKARAEESLEGSSSWLQADSKGGQMLKALGWREGEGIGARQQGILEPVLPQKRKHLLGLGAE